jgi:murein L,D-transpeptidase YafK
VFESVSQGLGELNQALSAFSQSDGYGCGTSDQECPIRVAHPEPARRANEEARAAGLPLGAPIFIRIFKYRNIPASESDPFYGPFQERWDRKSGDALMYQLIHGTNRGILDNKPPSIDPTSEQGGVLEVWTREADGKYELLKKFPIATLSGIPGPKRSEGDNQAPEGFYEVCASKGQLNPWSEFHLALDVGYPNSFDRGKGGTGGILRIHGGNVSAGCFAMTDPQIDLIYALAEAAINQNDEVDSSGHHHEYCVPVHIFPFAMTDENLSRFAPEELEQLTRNLGEGARDPGALQVGEFWKELKQGYDYFETTKRVPKVEVEGTGKSVRYVISEDSSTVRRRSCEQ